MFYSSIIFEKVGWQPRVGTAIVGVVNMVSAIIAAVLMKCIFFFLNISI